MKQWYFRLAIAGAVAGIVFACESKQPSSGRTNDPAIVEVPGQTEEKSSSAVVPATSALDIEAERLRRISALRDSLLQLPDSAFVPLLALDDSFVLDMKYATEDNFLQAKVYDCDQCFLRREVAEGLMRAQALFREQGYRIKLYDCYRPFDVQKKMWVIMPDDRYVANPAKGSIHNRGAAVDLTLVDAQGNELEMGTAFDFFGREAHHAYRNLPEPVLANRRLLKETMEKAGFQSITSEWWHYFYRRNGYPIANFKPVCPDTTLLP
jgi:zinc D-Ala-D-Ala dipeptidase